MDEVRKRLSQPGIVKTIHLKRDLNRLQRQNFAGDTVCKYRYGEVRYGYHVTLSKPCNRSPRSCHLSLQGVDTKASGDIFHLLWGQIMERRDLEGGIIGHGYVAVPGRR